MSESGSAEASVLLSQLTAHAGGIKAQEDATTPPTPSEAIATYLVTTQLIGSQRQLAESRPSDDLERTISRDVLAGTGRVLRAALAHVERQEFELTATPALHVVDSGIDGGPARLRRPRRSQR